MRADDLVRLRTLPFFAAMNEEVREALLREALIQSFPDQTELFRQNDKPDYLHLLLDGLVGLTGGNQEQETVVEFIRPGDTFVLAAVLTDAPYLMAARVIDRSRIFLIPAPAIREQIHHDSPFAATLLATLSGHYRRLVRQVKDLKLRTSTQRLGCYLLELADPPPGSSNGTGRGPISLALPVDKRLVAARLGMTPENLSRAFANLRPFGVRTAGLRVTLTDPDALRQICHPDAETSRI